MKWEKHPILKPPTPEEMAVLSPEELVALWNTYHEAIANAKKDPYRYGWVLPHWDKAWKAFEAKRTLLLLGANRSGKTTLGAKTVVKAAMENDGSLIFCFSQNQETSVLVQQSAVYDYLPIELKRKATEETHYISFSMQNGFANNSLVLPNKSRIVFKTYSQFQQNQSILEGMDLGGVDCKWINVGAWCDEYLLGMELLDRLYIRLSTRGSKLLLTFTPKDGITETVRYFINGAKTLESKDAEALGNKPVPYFQVNDEKNTAIIYFHSKENPWSGYETLLEQCRARNDENYTITALYGVPTSSYTTKFPNFSVEVNVLKHEKIDLKGKTKYMILDPAGRKNWFMAWVAVDESDTWYVYREWPDVNVGDWAESRNGKWSTGEGAKGLGYGIKDYVELITSLEAETADVIFERLIDPRLGAAKYQTQNGASSIIEDLADSGLIFIPAPGLDIEDGLQALQTKMSYNKKAPMDAMNRPHFYISDRCQNIIQALQEYTAEGGLEEAWKDPVDVLRYLAISGVGYVSPDTFSVKKTHNGGY
jgi:hypothetical protein